MSKATDSQPCAETDRRRSFRLEDRVILTVQRIAADQYPQLVAEFDHRRRSAGIVNDFLHARETRLPLLAKIARSDPRIARYLEQLEAEITHLAAELDALSRRQIGEACGQMATVAINLSAHGMRLKTDEYYGPDTLVELKLQLLPTRVGIFAYARVIWCAKVEGPSPAQGYHVGIEFDHIHPEDRELLARHIASRQLEALRGPPSPTAPPD